ncbi:MAG: MFS transporter, partial [Thermoplasmata archaeon]
MKFMQRVAKKIGFNVLLLSIVSFLNDASSEIIMPILPLFILSLGGDEVVIGLVSGFMNFISSTIKALFGFLSDKLGRRKPMVFSGYLLSASFKLLLSLSVVWQHILAFTSLERIGKGIRTAPRDAMISESMPEEKGKGFGIHRALDTFGAVIGATLAFVLIYDLKLSIRNTLVIASLISFFSLIPFIWIKETKGKRKKIEIRIDMREINPSLKIFLIIAAIFSLSNISYMFFLRRAQEVFETNMFLSMYIIFNIFYAIFSYPSGILSDKIGRWKVLSAGYLLFSLTSLGFIFANSKEILALLFSLYGISFAMFDGNQRAFVSDLSDTKIRATALGIFHTLVGVTALPAGM